MDKKSRIGQNEAAQALGRLLQEVESAQGTGLAALAGRQARRQARRQAVADRLAQALEADDPPLLAARRATERAAELQLAALQRSRRMEGKMRPTADQWLVSGHVRRADGRAAGGVQIRVYDADHRFDDLLGTTRTDDYGDFRVVYDVHHFQDEMGETFPDLYLLVADKQGRELLAFQTPIRFAAGRSEHFEIVLPEGVKGSRRAR